MDPLSIAALVTAVVTGLAWFTDSRRKSKTEPVAAITQGAATLASALDSVIGPLRDEVIELRSEVKHLRQINGKLERQVAVLSKTLVSHGITVPVVA